MARKPNNYLKMIINDHLRDILAPMLNHCVYACMFIHSANSKLFAFERAHRDQMSMGPILELKCEKRFFFLTPCLLIGFIFHFF